MTYTIKCFPYCDGKSILAKWIVSGMEYSDVFTSTDHVKAYFTGLYYKVKFDFSAMEK